MRTRIALIAVVLGCLGSHAMGEQFWYVQDGEAVPLIARAGRVAVFRADGGAGRMVADGRARSSEPMALPGWSVVEMAGNARADDARALVADALNDPAVTLAAPVFEGTIGPGIVVATDTIFVRFRAADERAANDAVLDAVPNAEVVGRDYAGVPGLTLVRIATRNGLDALDAANLLASDPRVEFAEPNFVFTGWGSAIPDDPMFGDQWALRNTGQEGGTPGFDLNAPSAWDLEPGDPSVVVAVLDVGVDLAHPDLTLAPGADLTTDGGSGEPINSCDRHGTWVAGCISSTPNNAMGIAGGAGQCRAASARIGIASLACDLSWGGQLQWTVDALNWAQGAGARVTNNSNSYNITSSAIRTAYETLQANGIVHFASAGNSGSSGQTYPASIGAVLGVGALNRSGGLAFFSNFGGGMKYTAPGEEILSTDRVGLAGSNPTDYAVVDGTSFASPYAASAAALVASLKPNLSAFDIESVLDISSTDLGTPGYDSTFGYGKIDMRAALEFAACFDSWSATGHTGPSARTNHAMAFDSARGVTVLFGGLPGGSAVGDTWEHDGAGWTQIGIAGPAARYGHAMAYDSARGVVVLHGGFVGAAANAETWEYDGVAWTQVSSTGPSARFLHAMAYDSDRGVTVLFGGRVGSVSNDETWEWNGTTWTQVMIAGPSARTYHSMAYDSARHRVVLFGGSVGGNETWEYDGSAWTQIPVAGPSSRERAALCFDDRQGACVLFGGISGTTIRTDTWEWNGTSWRIRTTSGPAGRSRHAMVYRSGSEDSFVFGGSDSGSVRLSDSWTWFVPAPTFTADPIDQDLPEGATAQFTVSAEAIGIPTYQWKQDGVDVVDGGRISGATTDTLTIQLVESGDAGEYTVVVSDPCGTTASMAAALTVGPACAGDVNGDGLTNSSDFNILASHFGQTVTPGADGDLTGDGVVNSADFNVLAGDFGCGS